MPRSRYKKSDEFHHSFIFIEMYYVYIFYSGLVCINLLLCVLHSKI